MKKTIICVLIACVAMFTACTQKNGEDKGYVITGTAEGTVDGDTIYICEMQGFFSFVPTDTAVVKDGQFEFRGTTDHIVVRYLIPTHAGDDNLGFVDFILENANININICKADSDGTNKSKVTSDGPEQKLWDEYNALQREWNERETPSWDIVREQRGTEEEIAAAQQELDSLTAAAHAAERQFMVDHIGSGVSDMIFFNFYTQAQDDAERQALLDLFAEKSPETYCYKQVLAEIEGQKNAEVGARFIDFTMYDTEGNPVTISNIVAENKYTLVDFWASWCGPCRGEMPNVAEAYNKYHEKGLEIVGVSLDDDRDAWLHGIEALKMPWPQLSDLKGWECAAATIYAVKSIPANLLIAQDGTIVAKNLREEELHNKLAELFD